MTNDFLQALARISWIATLVVALILLTRSSLRRWFGARLAYLVWAAVPVALLAAMLPVPQVDGPIVEVVAPMQKLAAQGAALLPQGSASWPAWMTVVWGIGAAAMLAWFWRDHARYRSHLGVLSEADGVLYSDDLSKGPAVIGLFRHAIVVPGDFSSRYSAEERRLILAHERAHALRRDPLANAMCALIQCALWFHPLVHFGARRFRLDQELSCDAIVMQAHPGLRRSYADAMLKTQLSSQAMLIHCHWQSIHPLKERIMLLKQTPPKTGARLAGRLAIAALVGTCGFGAMAAQATAQPSPQAQQYEIAMQINARGDSSAPRVRVRAGETFAVASSGPNGTWRGEFVLHTVNDQSVFLKTIFKHDDKIVGNPNIMVSLGTPAAVGVTGKTAADTLNVQLTVSAMP